MSAMRKKGKNKSGHCVYCGLHKMLTRDHVIPQCLFTNPLPPNLITAPVCDDCNKEKGRDDDFLRDFLASDMFGNQSPIANQIFHEKVLKSARRNSSELARVALTDFRIEPFYTTGSIYLSDVIAVPVDADRIERIMFRIVRGLYYDARRQRIPNHYSSQVRQYNPWGFASLWQHFDEQQWALSTRVLGNVFGCGFLYDKEDPFVTIWLISFYERVFFSVRTVRNQEGTSPSPTEIRI